VRKISKTLALMSLLAPLGANALGIGDIRLHSALNQSLNAEIPLETSGDDELSSIRVTLASPEAFSRAGIERHYSLSKLRFTPQQRADGSYVIKVSSLESIREPFLNFMIEVHWPQGRLQREFTVLLDPPASFQADEAAEEELPETEPVERPFAQPVRRPAYIEPSPVVEKPRRPARVVEAPEPVEQVPVTGTQYGPVNKNETLWGIAAQTNQDASVSQEKMMRALYKANPRAFYRNDINALKAGETITIPDRESITRLTGALSAPPTLRHTGRLAAKTARPEGGIPVAGESASPQGQLKLLAPTESGKSQGETAGPSAKGKAGTSKEDIALAVADTVKQENEEIRKSLADLKEQMSGMQRLLSLKDEQIAALQAQQKQAPQAAPVPPPAAQPTTPTAATPQPSMEPAKVPPVEPPKEVPRTVPAPQPAPEAQTTPKPAPPAPPPRPVAKQPPAPQPKPAQPVAPPQKDEGILAELLEHPSYTVAGGIVILLAAAVWLVKRRRAAMIDDTESILTLSDREKMLQAKRPAVAAPLGQTSGISEQTTTTTARSSFLSEFTPSDFDALGGEMEEVDPISEADVYLAYGRYKQAEELIHSAIAQNPERDECKLKLLEIHYATENAQAFEKFAEELAPTHKAEKPEFWEKVTEMGQELCPGSPLFGDGGRHQAPPAAIDKRGTSAESSLAAESGQEEEDYLFQKEDEESYGYPLSSIAENQPQDSTDEEAQTTAIAYDFFATEPAGSAPSEAGADSDLLQIDNIVPLDKSQTSANGGALDIQDKTLDDILAELGVLSESESLKPIPEAQEQEQRQEESALEFAFEPEQIPTADDEATVQFDEDSAGYMALTEMDEQETKLDLAKAYFDMGDGEAARAILDDVAEHGNDAQKQEAWSLLNRLTRKEVNRR